MACCDCIRCSMLDFCFDTSILNSQRNLLAAETLSDLLLNVCTSELDRTSGRWLTDLSTSLYPYKIAMDSLDASGWLLAPLSSRGVTARW